MNICSWKRVTITNCMLVLFPCFSFTLDKHQNSIVRDLFSHSIFILRAINFTALFSQTSNINFLSCLSRVLETWLKSFVAIIKDIICFIRCITVKKNKTLILGLRLELLVKAKNCDFWILYCTRILNLDFL